MTFNLGWGWGWEWLYLKFLSMLLKTDPRPFKRTFRIIESSLPHKTGLEGTSGLFSTVSSPPSARIPSACSSSKWSFYFKWWFHSGLSYMKMKGLSLSCSLWVLEWSKASTFSRGGSDHLQPSHSLPMSSRWHKQNYRLTNFHLCKSNRKDDVTLSGSPRPLIPNHVYVMLA